LSRKKNTVISRLVKHKDEESTCLTYTGLLEELEYLKIETRLIDEKFPSVMGECDGRERCLSSCCKMAKFFLHDGPLIPGFYYSKHTHLHYYLDLGEERDSRDKAGAYRSRTHMVL
jgi:hypothetical protein